MDQSQALASRIFLQQKSSQMAGNISWTEEAREAAREAKENIGKAQTAWQAAKVFGRAAMSPWRNRKPFKVVNYNPKSGEHEVLKSFNSLEEANAHPVGNYIIQTHEWVPQLGGSKRSTGEQGIRLASGVIAGTALGGLALGPYGALGGALVGGALSAAERVRPDSWALSKLPESKIYPKNSPPAPSTST